MSWLTKGPNGTGGASYTGGTTAFNDALLNAISGDLRVKGGPVDYAGNNLSNLGVLTFAAGGYLTGNILGRAAAIADTVASESVGLRLMVPDAAGYDSHIKVYGLRHTAGSDWNGLGLRLQHKVQAASMAYIEFNPTAPSGGASAGLAIGAGGAEAVRVTRQCLIGIGTNNPTISGTGKLHHAGDTARIVGTTRTPVSAADTGNVGEMCFDGSYIYVAVGANSWKRAAIAAW